MAERHKDGRSGRFLQDFWRDWIDGMMGGERDDPPP